MHGVLPLQQLNLQLFPSPVQLVNAVLQGWRKRHTLSSELTLCATESLEHVLERSDSFLKILQHNKYQFCKLSGHKTNVARNELNVIKIDLNNLPK